MSQGSQIAPDSGAVAAHRDGATYPTALFLLTARSGQRALPLYQPGGAHAETAASLYRPEEHCDSAFRYGQDVGVSAFIILSWALRSANGMAAAEAAGNRVTAPLQSRHPTPFVL